MYSHVFVVIKEAQVIRWGLRFTRQPWCVTGFVIKGFIIEQLNLNRKRYWEWKKNAVTCGRFRSWNVEVRVTLYTFECVCVPATSLKLMMIANPFYSASSYRHVNGHTAAATGEVKVWPTVRGYCSFENKNGGSSLGELCNFSIISFIRTGEYFFVSRLALACDRQQSSNHLSSTYLKMSASFQENIQHPSFQTPSSMDVRVKTLERRRLGSWRNTASSWLA